MITTKAHIYFSGNSKEVKITVDITDIQSVESIFKVLAMSIQAHNMQDMRLESIYFSEDERK